MQLSIILCNTFYSYIHTAKQFSNMCHCTNTKVATYWNRWSSQRCINDMDQTIDGWNVPVHYKLLIHQFLGLRVLWWLIKHTDCLRLSTKWYLSGVKLLRFVYLSLTGGIRGNRYNEVGAQTRRDYCVVLQVLVVVKTVAAGYMILQIPPW